MTSRDAEEGPRPIHPEPGAGTDGPRPGEGYAVEINSLKKILLPMEESVVAARRIKNGWEPMVRRIHNSATIDIVAPAKDMLSSWGLGMGRVADRTDVVVETLRKVISAYMLADLLSAKNFSPTEDNIAKLPMGKHGLEEWQKGNRPEFETPPRITGDPLPGGDIPYGPSKKGTQEPFPGEGGPGQGPIA
ncbi:hypothetical protein [Streptomyces iconiensis]|uniref:Uncharacterized protein n=1 Tax=Streptomyces iconiensis TaxID=1384038 RepID=A0ABT7A406_9ACTN|nr:hypothetical protein [Streptomyces iconiensis]MDJ1136065.1 hypothetical protein [Streptomyces iconiensis]